MGFQLMVMEKKNFDSTVGYDPQRSMKMPV